MRGRVAAVETLSLAAGGRRALPALVGAVGTVSLPVTHQAEVQAGGGVTLELGAPTLLRGAWRTTFCLYSQTLCHTSLPQQGSRAYNQDLHPRRGMDFGPRSICSLSWVPAQLRPSEAARLLAVYLHPDSSLPSPQSLCPSQRQGSGTHCSPLAQRHCLEPQRSSLGSQS